MCARTCWAAAVLAAAVAVYALVERDRRRLQRSVTAERLMAGCASRDSEALRTQLEVFRRRMDLEVAGRRVVAEADEVVSQALAAHANHIDPMEGGPR